MNKLVRLQKNMNKIYQNFAEILVDYPQIYGLRLEYVAEYYDDGSGRNWLNKEGFMGMCVVAHIFINGEAFKKIGKLSSLTKYWKRIAVKDTEAWFTNLEEYASLQGLCIWLNNTNLPATCEFYATPQASFYALTQLKHLELVQKNREYGMYIPNLPALRTLDVSGFANLQFEHILSLEVCTIAFIRQIDATEILYKLNPETLQSLSITDVDKVIFSAEFPAFPNLKFLDMKLDNLENTLPIFEKFKQLETLNLAYNSINALPVEMLELISLQTLDLHENPLTDKKIIENEKEIITLIKQDTALDIKQKLWAVLFEDKDKTQKITLTELLELLTYTKQKNIAQKIGVLCEDNFKENPLDALPALTCVAVVGKVGGMTLAEVREALKPHSITVTTNISEATQAICVGATPNPAEIKKLLTMPKKPIICLPAHLKGYMQKLEIPYLTDTTADIADNLRNLLMSDDKANTRLALQMMKGGGLPPTFLELLCLLWLEDTVICPKELIDLLKKYCTATQFLDISRTIALDDYAQCFEGLFSSKYLNQSYLVELAIKYFLPKIKLEEDGVGSFLKYLEKSLWKLEGNLFEKVLAYYLQSDGTLHLESHYLDNKLPPLLIGHKGIKKLMVSKDFEKNNLLYLDNLISSLPALKKLSLTISYDLYVTSKERTRMNAEEKQKLEEKYPHLVILVK